ncbi:MAG: serine hydrolase domain-containing protein [Bacteroidales bacterium]
MISQVVKRLFRFITVVVAVTVLAGPQVRAQEESVIKASSTVKLPCELTDDLSARARSRSGELTPDLTKAIDSLYQNFSLENHLPGISYGIIIDTALVYDGCTGFASLADGRPVTLSTAFRAASMTKSFTATAIMKLRDEGNLDLDDPIHIYLPELEDLRYLSADAPVLTIRHLLTHTGGFPQDDPWADRQLETTREELSAMIAEGVSMSNVPGITYEYSNLGYTLLGRVIRAVTGESYQSYISSNIFRPLGMTSTVWEYADLPTEVMAKGYRYRNSEWSEEPLLHDGPFGAMGGLISTVSDFARYAIMHLSAWPPRDDQESGPVKRSTLREMHSPSSGMAYNSSTLYPGGPDCHVIVAYGYGLRWSVDCMGRKKIYHNGGLPGFGSNWTIMPDYGIGVVAFSNRTYGSTWAINQEVLDLVIDAMDIRSRSPSVTGILQSRMNDLVRILPVWDITGCDSVFADNFFADTPREELRVQSARVFGEAGEILQIKEMVPENSLRGSFVMEGRNGNIMVRFTLTPEPTPKIQAFSIAFVPNTTEK